MSFVSSGLAVAGLLAASIPIVIHLLLRRRRRPVEWAAFDLLRSALRRHRRRARLERIILLTVRALLLAALGAALAQPLLGDRVAVVGPRTLHVVLDDGISSGVVDADGSTALERRSAEVRAVIDELRPSDRVGIVLAGRPVRPLVDPPSVDHEAAIRAIEGLPPREGATDLVAAMDLVDERLREPGEHELLVASDFRGLAGMDALRPAPLRGSMNPVRIRLTDPIVTPASSVRIEGLEVARAPWSLAGSESSRLVRVDLHRAGETPEALTTVRLSGDGIVAEENRTVEWAAGVRQASVEFQVRSDEDGGELVASVETVGGDDDLGLDDVRRSVVPARRATRVVVLDRDDFGGVNRVDRWRGTDWFSRALRPTEEGPLAEAIEIDEVDPATLDDRDLEDAGLVVVGRPDLLSESAIEELIAWTERGGVSVLLPPGGVSIRPWATPILEGMSVDWTVGLEPVDVRPPRNLAGEQPRSPITRLLEAELATLAPGVGIERRLPIEGVDPAAVVLVDDAGEPVLLQTSVGRGRLLLFTVAPELSWTDLPVRPFMVPLVQEIARQGAALADRGRDGVVGESLPRPSTVDAVAMIVPGVGRVALPASEDVVPSRSGRVEILDVADRLVERQSVNPAVEAVVLEPSSAEAVAAWMSAAGPVEFLEADVDAGILPESRSNLAAILIAVVLLLALVETLLARWFARGGLVSRRSSGLTGANADAEAASRARKGAIA